MVWSYLDLLRSVALKEGDGVGYVIMIRSVPDRRLMLGLFSTDVDDKFI